MSAYLMHHLDIAGVKQNLFARAGRDRYPSGFRRSAPEERTTWLGALSSPLPPRNAMSFPPTMCALHPLRSSEINRGAIALRFFCFK